MGAGLLVRSDMLSSRGLKTPTYIRIAWRVV